MRGEIPAFEATGVDYTGAADEVMGSQDLVLVEVDVAVDVAVEVIPSEHLPDHASTSGWETVAHAEPAVDAVDALPVLVPTSWYPPMSPDSLPSHESYEPQGGGDESFFSAMTDAIGEWIRDVQAAFSEFAHNVLHAVGYDTEGWPASSNGQFDPGEADGVIGNPAEDMAHWELQQSPDTCAVVAQKFIIEELTGREISQYEIVQQATDLGVYSPGSGTTMEDVGKLLEANGIQTETHHEASIDDLREALAQGEKVLVGVDGYEIWSSGTPELSQLQLDDSYGMPGSGANHCVQVIGINEDHPGEPMVILNDPGTPNGQGLMVPLSDFAAAWKDSGNFMVNTL